MWRSEAKRTVTLCLNFQDGSICVEVELLLVATESSISGLFTLETLITSLHVQLFPAWKRDAKESGSCFPFPYSKNVTS
jgi:hypothetical protein